MGEIMTDSKTPLFFVCRLLAPRPTFRQDMTGEERAHMQAHVGYWREAMARGKAREVLCHGRTRLEVPLHGAASSPP